jgi:hypothetical protein
LCRHVYIIGCESRKPVQGMRTAYEFVQTVTHSEVENLSKPQKPLFNWIKTKYIFYVCCLIHLKHLVYPDQPAKLSKSLFSCFKSRLSLIITSVPIDLTPLYTPRFVHLRWDWVYYILWKQSLPSGINNH